MNIRRSRPWQLPDREATDETAVLANVEAKRSGLSRRALVGGAAGLGALGLAGAGAVFAQGRDPMAWWAAQVGNDPTRSLYPAARTARYTLARPLTAARDWRSSRRASCTGTRAS